VLKQERYIKVALVKEIETKENLLVNVEDRAIALFYFQGRVWAIDNRCPHMGFPLYGDNCKDGIVTCPWHYARFDLASGGTFDSWADDVRSFPVQIRGEEIWLDLAPQVEPHEYHRQRLQDGLEQGISLVIAKSAIALLDLDLTPQEPFQVGLNFGCRYNKSGWSTGLSIHTCMMNMIPYLAPEDRPRALYHGLSAVARDSAGSPPRFLVHPLPNANISLERLKNWFRQFIEVRDTEAAERCLVSALKVGATRDELANMLFTAATDHRYIDIGHVLDFINKALEALDAVDWQDAPTVLASLIPSLATASRMEESNSWCYPVNLLAIVDRAFARLPKAIIAGKEKRGSWQGKEELVTILLGEDPNAIADSLLVSLETGCTEEQLAAAVTYAAALRVARFNTNNDFSDWDTAHHTFTFAHAVHRGLLRVSSIELLRGVFDAAMSVYLNRFLNVPPARIPEVKEKTPHPEELLQELPDLLDRQQQVGQAAKLVANYLYSDGEPKQLMAVMGKLMLRENRDFHVIQELEAAFQQYSYLGATPEGYNVLIAAVRYLAAHAPTMRSQGQTYQMAYRLHKGDRLFESESD
jgi:nitrite reductase/ring-hydroxylating ferredoxin subunit